jgi:uncharacterized membrane protein YjjP (DUF1212 family)
VATALVIFAVGGFTVLLSGFWIGLLAGFIATIVGYSMGYYLGKMTFQTGMSSQSHHGFSVLVSKVHHWGQLFLPL